MNRREFLMATAAGVAAGVTGYSGALGQEAADEGPRPQRLPRWRGFNLLEKFDARSPDRNRPFQEAFFEMIAAWGFDFVRLPMSYHAWSGPEPEHWHEINEQVLEEIDQAVEWGRQYGIHVNINFHRIPGYCVNPPAEPLSLWTDERAQEAAAFHWRTFARRYRGIDNTRLSFDLLNEPPNIEEATYVHAAKLLIDAIRSEDADRLIVADGLRWGNAPVHGLADAGVAQSTRGYAPMQISHYRAGWVRGSDQWPEPTWPLRLGDGNVWDRDRLERDQIRPWKELEAKGVGVHAGEWGAFRHTPHDVALAWMEDYLQLWQQAGWGWALWELRGAFGILNSGRDDVTYEDHQGHRLDRRMLELLRRY